MLHTFGLMFNWPSCALHQVLHLVLNYAKLDIFFEIEVLRINNESGFFFLDVSWKYKPIYRQI